MAVDRLALVRVHDVEPYLAGRRTHLRALRGENEPICLRRKRIYERARGRWTSRSYVRTLVRTHIGGGAMAAASARLEFRVRPDRKSLIERAAQLVHQPVGEFARTAAEEKADRIIREYEATTTVPAGFFDDLLDALDAPASPNAALTRAAKRARDLVTRD
jgi:uncharacterized protein (DUF1778 family)